MKNGKNNAGTQTLKLDGAGLDEKKAEGKKVQQIQAILSNQITLEGFGLRSSQLHR